MAVFSTAEEIDRRLKPRETMSEHDKHRHNHIFIVDYLCSCLYIICIYIYYMLYIYVIYIYVLYIYICYIYVIYIYVIYIYMFLYIYCVWKWDPYVNSARRKKVAGTHHFLDMETLESTWQPYVT